MVTDTWEFDTSSGKQKWNDAPKGVAQIVRDEIADFSCFGACVDFFQPAKKYLASSQQCAG
jgi:hypothetical protein